MTLTDPLNNFIAGIAQIVSPVAITYPEYREYPVEFSKEVLGVEWTEPIQRIAKDLLIENKLVVPAGHAVGKTHGVAGIAIWWLSTRKSKVVTTAPTWRQVKDLIWREIRAQHRSARMTLPGKPFTSQWDLSEDWFASGISTNESTRFQGYHAEELLVILDEACGIEKVFWEAVEDGLAVSEDNRILAIGNPTDPTGRFAQVCRSSDWKTYTLSCLDHPNVKTGKKVIPGAVSRGWVEERIKRWCIPTENDDSADVFEYDGKKYIPNDLFRVRILGEFPIEGGSQVIPLQYIRKAFEREPLVPMGDVYMGLDIARFGDDMSVLTSGFENGVVDRIDPWQGANTMISSGRVKFRVGEYSRRGKVVKSIAADEIGYGSGTVDDLGESGYPVIGVNVGESPWSPEMYVNLRDELTFLLAGAFKGGELDLTRVGDYEEVLTEELAAITFDYTRKGQRKVAPKAEVKSKLGRSPDFADSLYLYNAYKLAGRFDPQVVKKQAAESWDTLL